VPDSQAPSSDSKPLYSVEGYQAEESLGFYIGSVRSRMINALDVKLAPLGLTSAQWLVLVRVQARPGCTAAELCRCTNTDTGSMTRMIDRLEEKGFIRRVRSQEDRRVVHLEMTEAGKALYPQVIPPVVDLLNAHLQGFSQEELDTLIGFLKRIVANNEISFSGS